MSAVPAFLRVKGADGRRVGTYLPDELHAFKERIRESTRTARGVPVGVEHDPPDRRLAREVFTILPLSADGQVCGAVERWTAEEVAP